MYIYNETPSWVINWTNKVFTTLYEILNIEEVYVWWAPYRKISFSWNTITLVDAPPTWTNISVDYYDTSDNPIATEWEVTFWDLINEVYWELWQKTTSTMYLLSIVKKKINQFIKRLYNDKIYYAISKRLWITLSKKANIIEYNSSYINIWEMDNIPSQWTLLLNWLLISYSNYIDWKLMCTPWVIYKTSDNLEILYKLPTTLKTVSKVYILWEEILRDWYKVYNYNWDKYINIKYNDSFAVIEYSPIITELTDDNDLVNIEYEYSQVISYYVVYKMFLSREDTRYASYKNEYNEERRKYNKFKANYWDNRIKNQYTF